jgi:hypothetical protein
MRKIFSATETLQIPQSNSFSGFSYLIFLCDFQKQIKCMQFLVKFAFWKNKTNSLFIGGLG